MKKYYSVVYDMAQKNNGFITTRQFLELGLSKQTLKNYLEDKLLIFVQQGLYKLPKAPDDNHFFLMHHSPNIIFSHKSTLYLQGMDSQPLKFYVTFPNNKLVPPSIKDDCKAFYVKPSLHKVGLIEIKTPCGNLVRCYNMERTICDFIRTVKRNDEYDIWFTVDNYLKNGPIDVDKLDEYVKLFNLRKHFLEFLEVRYLYLIGPVLTDKEKQDIIYYENVRKFRQYLNTLYVICFCCFRNRIHFWCRTNNHI